LFFLATKKKKKKKKKSPREKKGGAGGHSFQGRNLSGGVPQVPKENKSKKAVVQQGGGKKRGGTGRKAPNLLPGRKSRTAPGEKRRNRSHAEGSVLNKQFGAGGRPKRGGKKKKGEPPSNY